MPTILFLCQRLPYPPNKGEKIRAYRLLAHVAERHRVLLGCFIDDRADRTHVQALAPLVTDMTCVELDPRRGLLRSCTGLLRGRPLSVAYYRDRRMFAWVQRMMSEHRPDAAIVYSSAMAQYVPVGRLKSVVIDFVDVDSDKWRQYAATKPWPLNWVYRREARTLLDFDRQWAGRAGAAVFVSNAEAALFAKLAPESADKVHAVANGVDAEYFAPAVVPGLVPAPAQPMAVFTGTMNYWPNEDAVTWFATEILPRLRQSHPSFCFYVVGAKPTRRVASLASHAGVVVTGTVDDVRPYIASAQVVVAPLRLARGVQNKVLEGMAMGKAVITTSQGLEGIEAKVGEHLLVADTAEAFARATLAALEPERAEALGRAARRRILEAYTWPAQLATFDSLLSF